VVFTGSDHPRLTGFKQMFILPLRPSAVPHIEMVQDIEDRFGGDDLRVATVLIEEPEREPVRLQLPFERERGGDTRLLEGLADYFRRQYAADVASVAIRDFADSETAEIFRTLKEMFGHIDRQGSHRLESGYSLRDALQGAYWLGRLVREEELRAAHALTIGKVEDARGRRQENAARTNDLKAAKGAVDLEHTLLRAREELAGSLPAGEKRWTVPLLAEEISGGWRLPTKRPRVAWIKKRLLEAKAADTEGFLAEVT